MTFCVEKQVENQTYTFKYLTISLYTIFLCNLVNAWKCTILHNRISKNLNGIVTDVCIYIIVMQLTQKIHRVYPSSTV